jgi:dipeptidase E
VDLLLLSYGTGAVPDFLAGRTPRSPGGLRLGYISDAAAPYDGLDFVGEERARIDALGHDVTGIRVRELDADTLAALLDDLDAVYVAGGSTFALLDALRSNGTADVLAARVRAGLAYIGASAGSIVTGPSIAPASLMDDPADAPDLHDHTGLGLIEQVVIPHADGALPPYPPELIEQTVSTYGASHPLLLLHDDQALLVDDDGARVVPSPVDES